jgi:hypothetical protein
MPNKPRIRRPSAAIVIACLALFVALGSATYAKVKLGKNAVKTKNIKNSAVKEPKIADAAVTNGKIADAAVSAGKLGANSVDGTKIADNAVTTGKLAAGSVTKGKVAASGSTTNAGSYSLPINTCTLDTSIPATGAEPGDAISYGVRVGAGVGSIISVAPAGAAGGSTISGGKFNVEVCSHSGTATITPGSITLDWVAIR